VTRRLERLGVPTLVLLALASSIAGLRNQFVYDDRYIVQFNDAVHSLHGWWHLFAQSYWPVGAGGDGYRPFSMLAFAVEHALGGGSPLPYHVVNLVLYAVITVLVFRLARLMLPFAAAWLVAALFAVHPVHVEAVANVVGQEELWVALFILAATLLYVQARRRGALRALDAAIIVGLYACACFAKEHGIVLPALLGVSELLLVRDARPLRARARELRPFILALVAVAIGFLAAHTVVLSSHGLTGFNAFVPFQTLKLSTPNRILTMFGVVPQWLRLFYWPARLRSEYAPPDIDIAQGFSVLQIPGMLLLAGVLALGVLLWRRRPVTSFGIAWVVIVLLPSSNFIVPAGIILAERTLFLPSVGAMLVVGDLALWLAPRVRIPRARYASLAAVVVLLALGIGRSTSRTKVWHDDARVFQQGVADAPESYRAYYMLGNWYLNTNQIAQAQDAYWKGLRLFPYDPYMTYALATSYHDQRVCQPAVALYKWLFTLSPNFITGRSDYAVCLLALGRYSEARKQAFLGMPRAWTGFDRLHNIVALADSVLRADSSGLRSVVLAGSTGKVPEPAQKAALRDGVLNSVAPAKTLRH
jgi:tetratricopeptide (TPR) repeat protein